MPIKGKYLAYSSEITYEIFERVFNKLKDGGLSLQNCSAQTYYQNFSGMSSYLIYSTIASGNTLYVKTATDLEIKGLIQTTVQEILDFNCKKEKSSLELDFPIGTKVLFLAKEAVVVSYHNSTLIITWENGWFGSRNPDVKGLLPDEKYYSVMPSNIKKVTEEAIKPPLYTHSLSIGDKVLYNNIETEVIALVTENEYYIVRSPNGWSPEDSEQMRCYKGALHKEKKYHFARLPNLKLILPSEDSKTIPTVRTQFLKDDYVVLIETADISGDFAKNYCYKCRSSHDYLRPYLDGGGGTSNGRSSIMFNMSEEKWRFANEAEIAMYDKLGKPFDISIMNKPEERFTKSGKPLQTFKVGSWYQRTYQAKVEYFKVESATPKLMTGEGWYFTGFTFSHKVKDGEIIACKNETQGSSIIEDTMFEVMERDLPLTQIEAKSVKPEENWIAKAEKLGWKIGDKVECVEKNGNDSTHKLYSKSYKNIGDILTIVGFAKSTFSDHLVAICEGGYVIYLEQYSHYFKHAEETETMKKGILGKWYSLADEDGVEQHCLKYNDDDGTIGFSDGAFDTDIEFIWDEDIENFTITEASDKDVAQLFINHAIDELCFDKDDWAFPLESSGNQEKYAKKATSKDFQYDIAKDTLTMNGIGIIYTKGVWAEPIAEEDLEEEEKHPTYRKGEAEKVFVPPPPVGSVMWNPRIHIGTFAESPMEESERFGSNTKTPEKHGAIFYVECTFSKDDRFFVGAQYACIGERMGDDGRLNCILQNSFCNKVTYPYAGNLWKFKKVTNEKTTNTMWNGYVQLEKAEDGLLLMKFLTSKGGINQYSWKGENTGAYYFLNREGTFQNASSTRSLPPDRFNAREEFLDFKAKQPQNTSYREPHKNISIISDGNKENNQLIIQYLQQLGGIRPSDMAGLASRGSCYQIEKDGYIHTRKEAKFTPVKLSDLHPTRVSAPVKHSILPPIAVTKYSGKGFQKIKTTETRMRRVI